MIKIVMLIILLLLSLSCSPKIVRHGYNVTPEQKDNCKIAITQNKEFSSDETEVISKIDIGDTGFTVNCDESDIINVLETEGCAVNADIINITKEKRPDWWSTCYRASAEFLRIKENNDNKSITNDASYQESEINKRVKSDNIRRGIRLGISAIIGVVIGIII